MKMHVKSVEYWLRRNDGDRFTVYVDTAGAASGWDAAVELRTLAAPTATDALLELAEAAEEFAALAREAHAEESARG